MTWVSKPGSASFALGTGVDACGERGVSRIVKLRLFFGQDKNESRKLDL